MKCHGPEHYADASDHESLGQPAPGHLGRYHGQHRTDVFKQRQFTPLVPLSDGARCCEFDAVVATADHDLTRRNQN